MNFKNYVFAESLSEAYELNKKKNNKIIGGNLWLRLMRKNADTAIDISALGLDYINETENAFEIGAMTPLHKLETNEGLLTYTKGEIKNALSHIVGVQFRNLATVGGSIFGRFGFSDVLTFFLALDCEVELFAAGRMQLKDFVSLKPDNDILIKIIINKVPVKISYLSRRNTETDFPVLALCVCEREGETFISVGARPLKARLVTTAAEVESLDFGSNIKASAQYRKIIAKVLAKRGLDAVKG